ncbi:unnamed protein product, partial [Brenthis ino]
MHCSVVILVGIVSMVQSQGIERCLNIVMLHQHCCAYAKSELYETNSKECYKETQNPNSCDFDVCLAKKGGLFMSNGTFDKIALEELLEKDFENYTGVSDVLKEKCLNKDLDAYVQEDPCNLKELGNCLRFYIMSTCKNWDESDECKKVKEDINKCQM